MIPRAALLLTPILAALCSPAAAADARLGPGAEALAARIGRALSKALDAPAPTVELEPTRVVFTFDGPPSWSLALTAPHQAPARASVSTRHGVLTLVTDPSTRLLAAAPVALPATRTDLEVPEPLHGTNGFHFETWSGDLGTTPSGWLGPPFPRTLPDRLATIVDGVPGVLPWITPDPELPAYADLPPHPAAPPPLPASMSSLLASDRIAPLGQLLGALETHPDSHALWAAAALAAHRAGDPAAASALAQAASQLPPSSADPVLRDRSRAHLQAARGEDPPALPGTALYLSLAAICWLVLAWHVGRAPLRAAVACAVGLSAVLGLLAARPPPQLPPGPLPPPALPTALAGGPCASGPALWNGPGWTLLARCDGAPVRFDLTWPDSSARVDAVTKDHTLTVESARAALRVVASTLTPPPPGPEVWIPRDAVRHPVRPTRDRHALAAALTLAVAALLALWVVQWLSWAHVQQAFTRRVHRRVVGALVFGACLSAAVMPGHLVLVYTGYDLTARLAGLGELPRYGAGIVWLYRPFLEIFGAEVSSLVTANRILGLLTLGPLLAATHAMTRRPLAALVAGTLYVGLPVFWRDHASEGMQSGIALLLASALAALWLAPRAVTAGDRVPPTPTPSTHVSPPASLVLAAPIVALACSCRPEVLPAALLIFVGFIATARPRPLHALLVTAAVALALTPHLAWLADVVAHEVASTGIATLDHAFSARVIDVLVDRNLLLEGHWVPLAATLCALIGLGSRALPAHGLRIALGLAAIAWIALSAVDLPRVSIPRVHLPAVLLLLPLMGAGAAALSDWPRGRAAQLALALATLCAAGLSLPDALSATRNDGEELLIQTAVIESRRPGTPCVATIGWDDPPPPAKTQRHFPSHRFDVPVYGLDRLSRDPATCGRGTVVLLGARCYMAMRPPGEAAPSGRDPLPICQATLERLDLEPVHLGEMSAAAPAFPMYPDASGLPVGVYRLR